MSSFNCIPNGCGRVVWRPYQKQVRYRYEGEDWQYVEGDSYEINEFDSENCEHPDLKPRVLVNIVFNSQTLRKFKITGDYGTSYQSISYQGNLVTAYFSEGFTRELNFSQPVQAVEFIRLEYYNRNGNQVNLNLSSNQELYCPDGCNFKVFQTNQIVHQETREDCPEVEIIDCQLSETFNEEIIEKFSILERVEVVDFEYQNALGLINENDTGLLVFKKDIPDHCLNIYLNPVATIVPQSELPITPTNSAQETYNLVGQICSNEGCPPPQFEVLCDCDCRSCPDGSCSTPCGELVCCNDIATGVLIESIPIDEYCEEES